MHFVVLGAGLFALHGITAGPGDDGRALVLDEQFVEGLEAHHARRTGTAPDASERRALLASYVREEVLYREAKRLGLDRGDPIVRQRLVQKMEFYLEGTTPPPEPTEEDLREHLRAHAERYRRPPRIAFRHVFFSEDRRGEEAEADARRALRTLRAGASDATPSGLGDPFVAGLQVGPRASSRIAQTFGAPFAEALGDLPSERWAGPLVSAHGYHVVRITERTPGGLPPLDEVRARVRAEWMEDRREEAVQRGVADLVDRYDIRGPEGARPASGASAAGRIE